MRSMESHVAPGLTNRSITRAITSVASISVKMTQGHGGICKSIASDLAVHGPEYPPRAD